MSSSFEFAKGGTRIGPKMRWLLAGLGAVLIDLAACGSWDTGKRYVPESTSEDLRVERFLAEALLA